MIRGSDLDSQVPRPTKMRLQIPFWLPAVTFSLLNVTEGGLQLSFVGSHLTLRVLAAEEPSAADVLFPLIPRHIDIPTAAPVNGEGGLAGRARG